MPSWPAAACGALSYFLSAVPTNRNYRGEPLLSHYICFEACLMRLCCGAWYLVFLKKLRAQFPIAEKFRSAAVRSSRGPRRRQAPAPDSTGAGTTNTSATSTAITILLPRRHRFYYDLVDFYRSSFSSHLQSHRSPKPAVNRTAAVHYPNLFLRTQRHQLVQSLPFFFVIGLMSTSTASALLDHRYPPAFDLIAVQDQQSTGQQQ
jgi:hypothetical protein